MPEMPIRPTSGSFGTALAVLVLELTLWAPAHADRYRVSFMGLPPFEVGDSAQLNPLATPQSKTSTAASLPPSTSPTAAVKPALESPVAQPGVVDAIVLPAEAVPLEAAPRPQGDLAELTENDALPPGEPPKGFADYLAKNYLLTDPADVDAGWRIARKEPADLGQRERWSNAVIRYTLANPDKISDASTADLEKDAPVRHVSTDKGLTIRTVPWGPIAGNTAGNVDVQVLGRDGIWFEVDYGGQRGWICGLWARAP